MDGPMHGHLPLLVYVQKARAHFFSVRQPDQGNVLSGRFPLGERAGPKICKALLQAFQPSLDLVGVIR